MNDAHSNVAVGEGCCFTPDLDEFWAADTWQLANGESLPGLAVVREGGASSFRTSGRWPAGEPSSHCSDPSSPGWPTTHLIRRACSTETWRTPSRRCARTCGPEAVIVRSGVGTGVEVVEQEKP